MTHIKWDKKFEVGNMEIDSEHRVFVRILQKIIYSVDKKNHKHTERLVNEIYKYADFHFHSEETIMIEMGYPDLTAHKKEHETLLIKLRDLISIIGYEDHIRPMADFISFLTNWFTDHTLTTDKKLADYLKQNEPIVDIFQNF